jgi:putative sterol carrier protein
MWVAALVKTINSDSQYARVAVNWEGDLVFQIDPDQPGQGERAQVYLDLWHGTCRSGRMLTNDDQEVQAAKFRLTAPRRNFLKVLGGELDPMQAMLTRRLKVDGDMGYLLRNIPTVLDFVRCARQVPLDE